MKYGESQDQEHDSDTPEKEEYSFMQDGSLTLVF